MNDKVAVKTMSGVWRYVDHITLDPGISCLHTTLNPMLAMDASKIEECRKYFPEQEFKVTS